MQTVRILLTGASMKKIKNISCRKGESILAACIREGEILSGICGGRGLCGKCEVRIVRGTVQITEGDRRFFSQDRLKAGYRLACLAYPKEECTIELEQDTNETFQVLSSYINRNESTLIPPNENSCYRAAADIGTTTVVMQLFSKGTNECLCTYTAVNPQRSHGGDVMTRIQASVEGKGDLLRSLILQVLQEGLQHFEKELEKRGLQLAKGLEKLVIAGNTTMIHLLMGYSCKGLCAWPFTPVTTEEIRLPLKELLSDRKEECPVIILPGISAFVGGDITAGLLSCGMNETDKINLFVDLGTNGEMAIGSRGLILTASTAAGPAFEGGSISCGMGSVAGAVSGVSIRKNGSIVLETIGKAKPRGLCGTGVVEAVYEGLMKEWIEDNGHVLTESKTVVLQKNHIVLTQRDIRELQLAKAAIRAGMETLMEEYGVSAAEIDSLYIAGGFGCKMNIKKAAGIGLIPPKLENKAVPAGNTALAGARACALLPQWEEKIKEIISAARELPLSASRKFQENYMNAMYFTKE